ncbi:MAG: PASTA domain-containing protein [Candidatus Kapaibacteriales bacterium]
MKESFKSIVPYLLVLFVFFLSLFVIVIIFDRVILPHLVQSQETVKMPNLIGKKISEAEKLISEYQLRLNKITELYSERMPEGSVINQSPRPGQMVKKGRDVFLTISKGMTEVIVPNLIGKNIRQARIELNNSGLEFGTVSYRNSETFGIDTIIRQNPLPMSKVPFGKPIDIEVSSGSLNSVKVPYLEGLNLENAIKLIKESELAVGTIQYVENPTYLPNTVLHQSVVGGALVNKGIKIDLTVVK